MLTAALFLPEGLREKATHTGHLGEAVKAKGLSVRLWQRLLCTP